MTQYWGIITVQGFSHERAKPGGMHPRFRIAGGPPHPILTRTTWGGQILTLHLNGRAAARGVSPAAAARHPLIPEFLFPETPKFFYFKIAGSTH